MPNAKPWLARYGGRPVHLEPRFDDCLSLFRHAASGAPHAVALRYFDGVIDYRTLDILSSRAAAAMLKRGVARGDRVAIIYQNIPQFPIAVIACWKIGAIPVPCNPMYSERELVNLFADAQPSLVMCQVGKLAVTAAAMKAAGLEDAHVVATSPTMYQMRNDERVLGSAEGDQSAWESTWSPEGSEELLDTQASPDDPGLLLYTSGTTGRPKGAILSHRALAFAAEGFSIWFELGAEARMLAIAPLFHITGFVCYFCAALYSRGAVIFTHRFHPDVALEAIREYRPTFTVAAVTAYIALMNAPGAARGDFSSFKRIYCGGAPIAPAVAAQFLARTGQRLLPGYGMTETCALSHVAPAELDVPVDAQYGAYAIGVPASGVDARIVDDLGNDLPVGSSGELLLRGPQLMSGYWRQENETRLALCNGWLRTGDVAVMDADGWFYIVDRKKDVIIASGYKVWPREVEDVLYQHPGVREAAVVGVPDAYRGETVKAYISLLPGARIEIRDLEAFCRARLAAFKVPRLIEILRDLPKTATGKVTRAALRAGSATR